MMLVTTQVLMYDTKLTLSQIMVVEVRCIPRDCWWAVDEETLKQNNGNSASSQQY